jgi:DNA integrity scanning protein DisA with diadenylate cyclase activity
LHPFIDRLRSEAKDILQRLDARFDPRVFLVSFPLEPKDETSIGLGPEDTPFRHADFSNVWSRAAELEAQDPEQQSVWLPDPVAGWTPAHERLQKNKERKMRCRALCQAVTEAVNAAPCNKGFAAYCSWPVIYNGDDLVLILQLHREVHDEYYHLKKGTYLDRRGHHEYRRERSLIDAVIEDFFIAMLNELMKENPGAGFEIIEDQDHLMLKAAKALMKTPAVAGGNEEGLRGLFDACNNLSTLKYEGKEGVGKLVFARPGHPQVHVDVTLTNPVPLRSLGAVRKLLVMASGHLSLLCDSYRVYGLGHVRPTYDLSDESVFTVHFIKQFVWALLHGEHPMMHVCYGEPSIRLPDFPEERFRRDLPRVFPGIDSAAVEQLRKIATCAATQKHGCMVVISGAAKEEAERLDAQCIRVEPFPLDLSVVPLLTAIDGSVLIDTDGTCHAIGVILDGMASPKCSPERGSRYNSAIRYVYSRKDAMAVVKSEDGMISVFPELRPQIRHSEIVGNLQSLRKVVSTVPIEAGALWDLLSWFHHHAFYLTASECEEVERLQEEAKGKRPPDAPYMEYGGPLTPHPEMDASYYLPD